MPKMIFVNLPVADLVTSTAFYEAIGFEKNDIFSNEQASGMGWSDAINVMLLDHGFYSTFTDKRIINAKKESGVLLALSFDSREAVDAITDVAAKAGGKADPCPKQDMDFMYGRSFEDLDGHIWEPMWMSADAV